MDNILARVRATTGGRKKKTSKTSAPAQVAQQQLEFRPWKLAHIIGDELNPSMGGGVWDSGPQNL